jgi:hypothetical protein
VATESRSASAERAERISGGAALAAAGIGEGTIRLSIGLEDVGDLIEEGGSIPPVAAWMHPSVKKDRVFASTKKVGVCPNFGTTR